jgi:hypothetical protein
MKSGTSKPPSFNRLSKFAFSGIFDAIIGLIQISSWIINAIFTLAGF